jgi:hypothetical protein
MSRDCFSFHAKSCIESERVFFVFMEGKLKNKIVFQRGYLGYLVFFTIKFLSKILNQKGIEKSKHYN